MLVSARLLAIVVGLLLTTASCQRASYSFQPLPASHAASATSPESAMPADALPMPAPPAAPPVAKAPQRSGHGRMLSHFRPKALGVLSSPRLVRPLLRPARPFGHRSGAAAGNHSRRPTEMSENTKVLLIGITSTVLLIGGGIVLLSTVAGGLAVTGGILLILAGALVGLLLLYAFSFGSQSMR